MHAALPENAATHVRVADYADGRLVLMVDSGTWATRLRYQQRAIDQSLARRLRYPVERLDVRVRPLPDNASPAPAPRHLSDQARRTIADCSRWVEDNPELAAALDRLAAAGDRHGD